VGFLLYGAQRNIAKPDVARGHSHATTMDGTLLAGREAVNPMDGVNN